MQSPSIKDDGISFIPDDNRVDIVKEISEKYWPHIRALGHHVVVMPYIRPKKIGDLLVGDDIRGEDMHHSTASQVIDIGPTAYKSEKYSGGLIWAEIGDWVFVPRVAGSRVVRKIGKDEVMFRIIDEDDIIALIKDPAEWEIRVSHTKF